MRPISKRAAISWLSTRLGSRFGYREDSEALLAEDRPSDDDIKAAEKAKNQLSDAMVKRSEYVLAADPVYQDLLAAYKASSESYNNIILSGHARRITVGRNGTFAFFVEADGDTWDEVVEKVKQQKEKP